MPIFHPDLAGRAVPRYTSYPTAAEFSESVDAVDQHGALSSLRRGSALSLYLHVPFCERICWYCGCNTSAMGRQERVTAYVDALKAEIAMVAALTRSCTVTRVHFGGGSPNALPMRTFADLCDMIRRSFRVAADVEWAAELDPRSLDADYAGVLAQSGIERVSLGVQTFSPAVQLRINREQPFRDVALRASELRRAGIPKLNLDLMYGLPGQTLDDLASTIARSRLLAPDRVAMFGYAHLPSQLPRQRAIDGAMLPDAKARFTQSLLAHDLLIEQGMVAVGFDHFARPEDRLAVASAEGRLRRNFQGFTDDPSDALIGLGASAISQVGDVIVQNEKQQGRYRKAILAGSLAGIRGVRLTDDDRLRGRVIERLLCDGTADLGEASGQGDCSAALDRNAHDRLSELVLRGLVTVRGTRITLTADGAPYGRIAASAFDRYRAVKPQGFSKAV